MPFQFHRREITLPKLLAVGAMGLMATACANSNAEPTAPNSGRANPDATSVKGLPTASKIHSSLSDSLKRLRLPLPEGESDEDVKSRKRVIAALEAAIASMLEPGSETQARNYYTKIGTELGIALNLDAPRTTLQDLLAFFGFAGLDVKELEQLPSDVLADPARLGAVPRDTDKFQNSFAAQPLQPGEILSSRFFAPKIVDASGLITGSEANPIGWRKVVRLNARPCSPAERKGVASAFILFNFILPLSEAPFNGQVSKNNQVMLTRRPSGATARAECASPGPSPQLTSPAYWMVFGPTSDSPPAPLVPALTGVAFELPSSAPRDGNYYVPSACAKCHGGQESPKLNFLDTDHWFDRVQIGDDFSALASPGRPGVLFDGGQDRTTPKFQSAFDVLIQLNREIFAQNLDADGGFATAIQTRATQKWVELHGGPNRDYLPPIRRALEMPGFPPWNPGNPKEVETLGLLNRFCYRCHSSVSFSIYDRFEIADRGQFSTAQELVNSSIMPIDRTLQSLGDRGAPAADQVEALRRLVTLLDELFKVPPT